ncbi:MAG: flavin reductase family protein [Gammaproteobacteria bacterium]
MTVISQRELRKAFGTFMTGVTVVTAFSQEGSAVGFTANSFTTVSLEPPLVLVCPSKSLSSFDAFNQCKTFTVNILAEDQKDIANVFARPVEDRFSQVEWHTDSVGCPLFTGVTASFSCSVHDRVEAGDHLLLIGQVEAFETHDKPGLGYSNGGYFSLGLERYAAESPRGGKPTYVGAIIEHRNHVLLTSTPDGWRPPEVQVNYRAGSLLKLREHLLKANIDVRFGPVYSVFESKQGEYSAYYRGFCHDDVSQDIGEYVPIDKLDSLQFTTPVIADMMRRWVLERQHGVFQLYVGDEPQSDENGY